VGLGFGEFQGLGFKGEFGVGWQLRGRGRHRTAGWCWRMGQSGVGNRSAPRAPKWVKWFSTLR
jgi:hypothetical protein